MLTARRRIMRAVLVFLVGYPLLLIAWLQVGTYYAEPVARIGAELAAMTVGGSVEKIHTDDRRTHVSLTTALATPRGIADLVVEATLSISGYTYNIPLTGALMAAAWVFFRWPWYALAEALAFLAFGHLLYIYSHNVLHFREQLIRFGARQPSFPADLWWQFLWAFVDNLMIRFEPFLIPVLLWFIHTQSHSERGYPV